MTRKGNKKGFKVICLQLCLSTQGSGGFCKKAMKACLVQGSFAKKPFCVGLVPEGDLTYLHTRGSI